ncbi:MAG: 3'-5' exonuclease domain-containing protein 2 [Prevotella sp.]|nr:3'-5' exonuclease domain-containing protein 2 [Prevotella sp.]
MAKIIYNHINKNWISKYPIVKFSGRIVVVLNAQEADKAVSFLLSQPLLGIDTETRPSFKKGKQNNVALLQVSTPEVCFLFRLNIIGMTDSIIRLLENKDVVKVGVSLNDDLRLLHKNGEFEPGSFIDLQNCINNIGIEDKSLQKLYANLFHKRITKGQQLSNWEADILTESQKLYAATDAWACINIYKEFKRLSETGDYQLIKEETDNNGLSESISKER